VSSNSGGGDEAEDEDEAEGDRLCRFLGEFTVVCLIAGVGVDVRLTVRACTGVLLRSLFRTLIRWTCAGGGASRRGFFA
jgi:hypothetical protein